MGDIEKKTPTGSPADEHLVYGRNAVRELLASDRDIDKLFVARGDREGSMGELVRAAVSRHIPVVETDRRRLDTMTSHAAHQGVVASVAVADYVEIEDILRAAEERGEPPFLILCDGVEDPHNLGAIIRTAECMGAHGVVIPKRRSVGLTSVVAKSSAGALAYMSVARVTNLASAIAGLKKKNIWVYAADMDGTPYTQADLKGAIALVLGSEGQGVSRLVREECDGTVSIPQFGHINSLNVSNAAAILMCEIARQRHDE